MIIEIKKAEYLSGYKIRLAFSDNNEKVVDFETFIKNAKTL